MGARDVIIDAFPEVDDIDDRELREKVLLAWEKAMDETGCDDLHDVVWWPGFPEAFDDELQVPHIRQVTKVAVDLTDSLTSQRGELVIDRDTVIAGGLLHDVSKLYEIDGNELTDLHEYVTHPHYGVHVLADVGLSPEMINVVLCHTELSNVEPKTIEAKIVEVADHIVTQGVFWEVSGDFKPDWGTGRASSGGQIDGSGSND